MYRNKNNIYPLNEVAEIQSGVFAKPEKEGVGSYVYLQARHFDAEGRLTKSLFLDLANSKTARKHRLCPNDVLFAAKGAKNFATLYEAHNPPAVASTTFLIIRVKNSIILPEYLTWYINTSEVQTNLQQFAKGTSIKAISKKTLESLDITLPSIINQRIILEIAKLRVREREISETIQAKRNLLIDYYISKALK